MGSFVDNLSNLMTSLLGSANYTIRPGQPMESTYNPGLIEGLGSKLRNLGGYFNKAPNNVVADYSPSPVPQQLPETKINVPQNTQPVQSQQPTSFGIGTEEAKIEPKLYDALMKLVENELIRMKLAELSGQESSYGYNLSAINPKEESYGPYHINLKAGRKNPQTGKPFTQEEAMNPEIATQYALAEYLRTGGLGLWNPIKGQSNDFYQYDIPTRAATKKFTRG